MLTAAELSIELNVPKELEEIESMQQAATLAMEEAVMNGGDRAILARTMAAINETYPFINQRLKETSIFGGNRHMIPLAYNRDGETMLDQGYLMRILVGLDYAKEGQDLSPGSAFWKQERKPKEGYRMSSIEGFKWVETKDPNWDVGINIQSLRPDVRVEVPAAYLCRHN